MEDKNNVLNMEGNPLSKEQIIHDLKETLRKKDIEVAQIKNMLDVKTHSLDRLEQKHFYLEDKYNELLEKLIEKVQLRR